MCVGVALQEIFKVRHRGSRSASRFELTPGPEVVDQPPHQILETMRLQIFKMQRARVRVGGGFFVMTKRDQ